MKIGLAEALLFLRGLRFEECAALIGLGRGGLMLLLPVVPSLSVCVYQVSRAITESRIPKSHYYNSFLLAGAQS